MHHWRKATHLFFMGSPSDCLCCLWQDSRDLSKTTHEIWQSYIDVLSIVVRWFIIWRPSKSITSAFFKIDSAVTEGSGYIYCTALPEFLYSAKSVSQTFSWYIYIFYVFCLIFYRQLFHTGEHIVPNTHLTFKKSPLSPDRSLSSLT